uniref:Uncharacterized protein n=1 Tax=Arundo donax TaxID=35708 RepID=A0A0A9FL01_ARUDO
MATTQPRTPEPPREDPAMAPGGGLGIPGKQTLTKDVLGSAADW